MLKISNVEIYGIKESLIASSYPMTTKIPQHKYQQELDGVILENLSRGVKLGNAKQGSGHDCAMKGIVVQFDVKYPEYISPEMQRYHWFEIVSSQSKMHRLTHMNINDCCNKYVDDVIINNLNKWIGIYNGFENGLDVVSFDFSEPEYSQFSELDNDNKLDFEWNTKYEIFMRVLSNCPMGLEKTMRISTNYLQLKTMYHQRNSHKLKEDWSKFCAWCESLTYFVDMCLSGQRKFTDEKGEPLNEIFDWRM